MQQPRNPGLTPCICHPEGDGVVLLDFDEDFLRTSLYEDNGTDVSVVFRSETHTFPSAAVSEEVSRRFGKRFEHGR